MSCWIATSLVMASLRAVTFSRAVVSDRLAASAFLFTIASDRIWSLTGL